MAAGFTAVGRYARPAEIAATVAHLASADGAYITGASIHVDGGFTAWRARLRDRAQDQPTPSVQA